HLNGTVPDDLIRSALFGPPAAADLTPIGYELRRVHVAVALDPSLDDGAVVQLVSRLALEASAKSCMLHLGTGWVVWLGLERPLDQRCTEKLRERLEGAGGAVGVGDAAAGVGGFRSTYRQALDARRVGLLRNDDGVTMHHDVALLAVLCADTERARALARDELGPLLRAGDVGA